jgi:hypothetical protein
MHVTETIASSSLRAHTPIIGTCERIGVFGSWKTRRNPIRTFLRVQVWWQAPHTKFTWSAQNSKQILRTGMTRAQGCGGENAGDDPFDSLEGNDWSFLEGFVTWSPWLYFLSIEGKWIQSEETVREDSVATFGYESLWMLEKSWGELATARPRHRWVVNYTKRLLHDGGLILQLEISMQAQFFLDPSSTVVES